MIVAVVLVIAVIVVLTVVVVVLATSPCRRHVVAMSSPCRRHVVPMSSPCRRHVVAMPSPSRCHVVAVSSPCRRNAVAMLPPCHGHVIVMSSPFAPTTLETPGTYELRKELDLNLCWGVAKLCFKFHNFCVSFFWVTLFSFFLRLALLFSTTTRGTRCVFCHCILGGAVTAWQLFNRRMKNDRVWKK